MSNANESNAPVGRLDWTVATDTLYVPGKDGTNYVTAYLRDANNQAPRAEVLQDLARIVGRAAEVDRIMGLATELIEEFKTYGDLQIGRNDEDGVFGASSVIGKLQLALEDAGETFSEPVPTAPTSEVPR